MNHYKVCLQHLWSYMAWLCKPKFDVGKFRIHSILLLLHKYNFPCTYLLSMYFLTCFFYWQEMERSFKSGSLIEFLLEGKSDQGDKHALRFAGQCLPPEWILVCRQEGLRIITSSPESAFSILKYVQTLSSSPRN